jgi:energy-coupling factor transporter ATP-binding protein EcfA2/GNAT superfamily N-acetyltransferase
MRIDISYESAPVNPTERTAAVQDLFGIGAAPREIRVADGLQLDVNQGQVLLVTGPSGSGKSSILRAIRAALGGRAVTADSLPRPALPVIDCLGEDLDEALRLLGICGLSEAFLFLRLPGELSDGQKYRLGLALALGSTRGQDKLAIGLREMLRSCRTKPHPANPGSGAEFVVADEFCSMLDRTTAKVIAYNVRKLASAGGPGFVLATAHEDIIEDLQPDILVRKGFGGDTVVERRSPERRPVSFFSELQVEPGTGRDWKALAAFHYKSKHLGAVDKIFRLRLGSETAGVVVYAYPAPHNSIRNQAFGGRYCGRLTARERRKLLNRELRVVQRIVIDPRLRGLGLASHLLRETLPALSVPFVECIAVMAGYSRFLENAGFACLGRTGLPKSGRELLGALRGLGLDNATIHNPAALTASLRLLLHKHPGLARLLSAWWGTRRPGALFGKATLEVVAREVARHITSRPFYYLYDNRNSKAPSFTAGKVIHHPRVETRGFGKTQTSRREGVADES